VIAQEWRDVPAKAEWGPGPWQDEPDRVQWTDEATGLACLAVRHEEAGHWCGYVGLPEGHPFHGAEHNDERFYDMPSGVVWGLTYAAACAGRICHVVAPGEPEVWWLGFDFAHAGDRSPGRDAIWRRHNPGLLSSYEVYRTLDHVRDHCTRLAAELTAAAGAA
jgi:hypothetical protein